MSHHCGEELFPRDRAAFPCSQTWLYDELKSLVRQGELLHAVLPSFPCSFLLDKRMPFAYLSKKTGSRLRDVLFQPLACPVPFTDEPPVQDTVYRTQLRG